MTVEAFRVLIVEDHPLVVRSLGWVLGDLAYDACPTLADARRLLATHAYDAILLDVFLPDGSGIELLTWLRTTRDTPVLVLTADERVAHANRAQLLGAEIAYKPDVAENVRAFIARARAQAGDAAPDRIDELARAHGLSPRERDVLRILARGERHAEAAEKLGIGPATVKTLVRRLLARTNFDSVQKLLETWRPTSRSAVHPLVPVDAELRPARRAKSGS